MQASDWRPGSGGEGCMYLRQSRPSPEEGIDAAAGDSRILAVSRSERGRVSTCISPNKLYTLYTSIRTANGIAVEQWTLIP